MEKRTSSRSPFGFFWCSTPSIYEHLDLEALLNSSWDITRYKEIAPWQVESVGPSHGGEALRFDRRSLKILPQFF